MLALSPHTQTQLRANLVGRTLKAWRLGSKLTQHAIAKELGFRSPQLVSNWERGVSLPSLASLPRLSRLYRVSNDEMVNLFLRYQKRAADAQQEEIKKLFAVT